VAYTEPKQLYYGRGYVQLTWLSNYRAAGRKLGLDLVGNPALALEPGPAAQILVRGMVEGWFTGKKLSAYFTPMAADPTNARRIINGTDKAALIAGYHGKFLFALTC
jgi:putative chitinase